jgi:hypothetical protein
MRPCKERRAVKNKKKKVVLITKKNTRFIKLPQENRDVWKYLILPLCDSNTVKIVCKQWYRWYWENFSNKGLKAEDWDSLLDFPYPKRIQCIRIPFHLPLRIIREQLQKRSFPNVVRIELLVNSEPSPEYIKKNGGKVFDFLQLLNITTKKFVFVYRPYVFEPIKKIFF